MGIQEEYLYRPTYGEYGVANYTSFDDGLIAAESVLESAAAHIASAGTHEVYLLKTTLVTATSLTATSAYFSATISGQTPTKDNELATKAYADSVSGAGGVFDTSYVWDHGTGLSGLSDDDHPQYTQTTFKWDHGTGLSGLSDDDHTIYSKVNGTRAYSGILSAGAGFWTSLNSQAIPISSNSGGLEVTWNRGNGTAEVDFWNRYPLSPSSIGGYTWWQSSGTSAANQLMRVDGVGCLSATSAYFSATISGQTPTKDNELATKAYADSLTSPPNIITITATGATNWNKPAGRTWCLVRLWGGGGSGGKTATNNGGGGGGGGAYTECKFLISALSDPVSVTVGAGGAAQTTASTKGNVGGNITFGAYLTAYGGGAGGKQGSDLGGGGGGGGGALSIGADGLLDVGGVGGRPMPGTSSADAAGGDANFGGGGGGSGVGTTNGLKGGDVAWGGGGGGSGVYTGEAKVGGTGGNSILGGGGGGGGVGTGTGGAGGVSNGGGNGGAGATADDAGEAGTQPGGGGGGTEAGTSGAGGDGMAQIISW